MSRRKQVPFEMSASKADQLWESAAEVFDASRVDVAVEGANPHVPEPPAEPVFADVYRFVQEYLLPHWRHQESSDEKWCARWFEHTEAVSRLHALWWAWESCRNDGPTGLAHWWRDWCNPLMLALCHPNGTFANCGWREHRLNPVWPMASVPPDVLSVPPPKRRE